jgi:hypothetical protein
MANDLASNFTRKLAPVILKTFETERTLSKNVNTQLLEGKYSKADTGDDVDFKRPTDYVSVRTPKGDISAETASSIITGKATGSVQDYFTVFVDFDEADEALKMHQKNELVNIPMMTRLVTDFELDWGAFMLKNTALLAGTPGTAVSTWKEIANAGATMQANGCPGDDEWCYALNPFAQVELADQQRALGVNPEAGSANSKAVVRENFAGMKVMTCTSLGSYNTGAFADRAGTLTAAPDATYVTAKDSFTQVLAVTALQANIVVPAGTTVQVAGANRLNLSTRQPVVNGSGAQVLWTGTVTTDVTLSGAGAGNLTVTGPAIQEAGGQYNTVDTAIANGAVVTLLGAASTIIQPSLFWHKQAFSVGSVPIKKLYSTDTLAQTKDNLQLRISMGSDFLGNSQKVRIDFRPAYAALNPFLAGQGFGTP